MTIGKDGTMKRRSLLKTGAVATAFGIGLPNAQAQENSLAEQLSDSTAVYRIKSMREENGETVLTQSRRVEVSVSEGEKEGMVSLHTEIFDGDELEQKDNYSTHISRLLSPVSGNATNRGPVEIKSSDGLITKIRRDVEESGYKSSLEVDLIDSSGLVGGREGQALHLLPTFVPMFGGTPVVQPRGN